MSLAKDPLPYVLGGSPVSASKNSSSLTLHGVNNNYHNNSLAEDEDGSVVTDGLSKISSITTHSCSMINFRGGGFNFDNSIVHSSSHESSLLRFHPKGLVCLKDDYPFNWESNNNSNNDQNHHRFEWSPQIGGRCNTSSSGVGGAEPRLFQDLNCLQTASDFHSILAKENQNGENPYGWLYSDSTVVAHSFQDSGDQESILHKRSSTGASMQGLKKQCTTNAANKKPKPKSSPSKDPQSIAAKNRRERISERLKILQELVPNGSKVDLVTMLEKAISYVKFLQLQVKVLATDEFWPVQGGKAPDISQVKEAIDAILSSQKDRKSSK